MPAGRPPKPTALKRLAGNPGKRVLNGSEPQPELVVPAMPGGLTVEAQAFWKAHAGKLEKLGLLTEVDGPAFTLMAMHYGLACKAVAILQEYGVLDVDENGATRKHPALQVFKDNSTAFLRYAVQFGLTPSARARVQMPDESEELSLAEQLIKVVNGG